ncbi:MAG TPA: hypothetical protein VK737_04310 [Opitutales bacterium]|jgi:hypothetical protein|nr:hypothetical protein [Opitutales bacterium]
MRNKIIYFSGLALLSAIYAATPASAPTSAPVTMPTYGFSINPLDMPTDGPVLQALQMSLPLLPMPTSKFSAAPAVNVIVWPGTDNFEDYKLREKLDLQMKGMIIKSESPANATDWVLEYTGVANGITMHWYAHIVNTPKRIFIATGMAPDEMWSQYSDKIKACVDSLKSTNTAVIAPIPGAAPAATSGVVPKLTP